MLSIDRHVLQEVAVDLFGHFVGIKSSMSLIIPFEVQDGFGKDAVFLIKALYFVPQGHKDMAVGPCLPRRVRRLVAPLHPAAAVGNGAFFFNGNGARQEKDLGLDLFGIHAGAFPERPGFVVKEIDVDHPVQLGQPVPVLLCVGA